LKFNLANILTLLRIAAIPIVVVCFYSPLDYARPIAAILFGLAAITDLIDGWVARRFGQMSRFGEFLDPVADKLMVAIVLVMLVQAESSWFEDIIAMIIIGREITISALREWMATIGERANVKVDITGKIKTTLQMFGIAFMVYQNDLFGIPIYTIGFVLLILAAVMTIWSMIVYLRAAWPFIKAEQGSAASGYNLGPPRE
jgi:CDP-diacylglycerol--glycerol-3-phosphate 3-phosphatidyltransferase/cardiolipin synthase